ncbi:MAG: hypothetical protein J7647_16380 [Cyanobacteria bacterium SBLK]|nr:hypothetical protein [Cyanobacteria bacterium SBLK]
MNWPDDMAKATKKEFSALLYNRLVDEKSFYSLNNQSQPSDLSSDSSVEWLGCDNMIHDFIDSITENKDNPKFRRGNIEDILRKHLEIDMKSYDEIKSRGLTARPDKNLKFAIGYYISNLTS